MKYRVVKTYGHNEIGPCTFRQHRAKSHCRFIHGYALAFELTFESEELDENGWVIDFGSLRSIKDWLQDTFDHKTLVADDDPKFFHLEEMASLGLIDMRPVAAVGVEKFAEMVFDHVDKFLQDNDHWPRVNLVSVKVSEHSGNSAVYLG